MNKLIYLLAVAAIWSCSNDKQKSANIENFFNTMAEVVCVDSVKNTYDVAFKYASFNEENMLFEYLVPDSLPNSDFYNAYAGRLISAFYNLIYTDTTGTYNQLLSAPNGNKQLVHENVVNYCSQNPTWNAIFTLAQSGFYDNKSMDKAIFTLDSLINMSMAYFDIAGYSAARGFAFHFVCGTNPVDFTAENKTALLVCDFCQEALQNPEMNAAHQKIIAKIESAIKLENDTIDDFQKIKQQYEPKLHGLLKNEQVLKASLIAYYQKRKQIEPFVLEY